MPTSPSEKKKQSADKSRKAKKERLNLLIKLTSKLLNKAKLDIMSQSINNADTKPQKYMTVAKRLESFLKKVLNQNFDKKLINKIGRSITKRKKRSRKTVEAALHTSKQEKEQKASTKTSQTYDEKILHEKKIINAAVYQASLTLGNQENNAWTAGRIGTQVQDSINYLRELIKNYDKLVAVNDDEDITIQFDSDESSTYSVEGDDLSTSSATSNTFSTDCTDPSGLKPQAVKLNTIKTNRQGKLPTTGQKRRPNIDGEGSLLSLWQGSKQHHARLGAMSTPQTFFWQSVQDASTNPVDTHSQAQNLF